MRRKKMSGTIRIRVKGQDAEPKWKQTLLRRALKDGMGATKDLRYQCRIAQDSNTSVRKDRLPDGTDGLFLSDGTYVKPRPQSPAHFGRNARNLPYLTIGLNWSEDGADYKVTWTGDKIPMKMKEAAVKHDEGRKVGVKIVDLNLADATIVRVRHDLTKSGSKASRKPAKTGPHLTKKKQFNRICAEDLITSDRGD
jgi:hypothetical protein